MNRARHIHFWSHHSDSALTWTPDREPERFANGHGHTVVEMYAHLRDLGSSVTIGPRAPKGTDVIVTSLDRLVSHHGVHSRSQQFRLALATLRVGRLVVIRNDIPLNIASPRYCSRVVAPNTTAVRKRSDFWLPILPQRGLRRRRGQRSDTIACVALKARVENLPDYIVDGSLAEDLQQIGVSLRVDTDPRDWPDFEDVDVVLCVRRPHPSMDVAGLNRKPATKLTNAWLADCIPLIEPEPAYMEIAAPGDNCLVVESAEDILSIVTRLRSNPTEARRLFVNIERRAHEVERSVIVERWRQVLFDEKNPSRRLRSLTALLRFAVIRVAAKLQLQARSTFRRVFFITAP